MVGTIYCNPDVTKDWAACQSCYNGLSEEEKAPLIAVATFTDNIRLLFKGIDADGDQLLSSKEFKEFFSATGCPPAMIEQLFTKADTNKDGVIQFAEFWWLMRQMCHAPEAPPDLAAALITGKRERKGSGQSPRTL